MKEKKNDGVVKVKPCVRKRLLTSASAFQLPDSGLHSCGWPEQDGGGDDSDTPHQVHKA